MDVIQPISALVHRIHGKSLRAAFESNPDMMHMGQNTRYLICIIDLGPRTRYWVKPPRFLVNIHRAQQGALNEVAKFALQVRRSGGKCFWATSTQILEGKLHQFADFWKEYMLFLERRATANHADATKGALLILAELMDIVFPDAHDVE